MASDVVALGRYYVYMYRDPRPGNNNCPIYIGKGTVVKGRPGWRANTHWRHGTRVNKFFRNVLLKIKSDGLIPGIEIMEWFDDEGEAFSCEIALIRAIGRRDLGLGTLLNLSNGGEGNSGYVPPPELCAKHSRDSIKLWSDASPELREAMNTARNLWKNPEHHAQRSANIAEGRAKRWLNPEIKAQDAENIRQAKLADRDTISAKAKAHIKTPEHIKNAGDAKRRDAANGTIGQTSEEVWEREGMKEFISERISEGQTAAWAEPRGVQRKKNARKSALDQFADPEKAEKHRQACLARDEKGGGLKARYADPEQAAKIIAKRNATSAKNREAKQQALLLMFLVMLMSGASL